jgi:8-oxo-dGTP pyrophosphatase MutT (NUDIX family)
MSENLACDVAVVSQAGAVAIRGSGPALEVLIVSSKKNPADWIFPKGHVEPDESQEAAALRELSEEAGVIGDLVARLGSSRYALAGREFDVSYFLVRFREQVPAVDVRAIRWLSFADAAALLSFDTLREHLEQARHALGI